MKEYTVYIYQHKKHAMRVVAADEDEAIEIAEDEFLKEFYPEEDWDVGDVEEVD